MSSRPSPFRSPTATPPWREVKPLAGGHDEKACLIFVSLACPFCAQYHAALWNWARSLPPGWSARFVPVLQQGQDSFIELKAIEAAQKANPEQIGEFLRTAYFALQQQGQRPDSESTWRGIVSASGYSLDAFSDAWRSMPAKRDLIDPIVQRQAYYGIEVTPTVIVGGRYIVTPDNTNGNEGLFMQLLNAMVSKAEGAA